MAFRTISPREAAEALRDRPDDVYLLDCREPEEVAIASVPGANVIPMMQVPARQAEIDRARDVLVLCHTGRRSTQVGVYLARLGFPRVASVEGGIDAWAVEVDPTLPRY